jgi:hypothetical protein
VRYDAFHPLALSGRQTRYHFANNRTGRKPKGERMNAEELRNLVETLEPYDQAQLAHECLYRLGRADEYEHLYDLRNKSDHLIRLGVQKLMKALKAVTG